MEAVRPTVRNEGRKADLSPKSEERHGEVREARHSGFLQQEI